MRLAATLRRNLGKTGGTSVESPNAYVPGGGSVAENSAEFFKRIREGRARDKGLLYDHREAPADTDLGDSDSLMRGLAYAYGDSAAPAGGWVNLERIASEIWDPDTDPQDAHRFYLGQITHAADSWISQPEWAGVTAADKVLADKETVVLGFDGSRRRSHAVTDATALVGCRVSDGHLFLLGCWEQPEGPQGRDWEVPTAEVLATVADAFKRYRFALHARLSQILTDPWAPGNWPATPAVGARLPARASSGPTWRPKRSSGPCTRRQRRSTGPRCCSVRSPASASPRCAGSAVRTSTSTCGSSRPQCSTRPSRSRPR